MKAGCQTFALCSFQTIHALPLIYCLAFPPHFPVKRKHTVASQKIHWEGTKIWMFGADDQNKISNGN